MLELSKGAEVGSYVVHEVIGTGGYASVWKAFDKELKRDVALKRLLRPALQLQADDVAALKEEARKNAKLVHPNIVQVYSIVEVESEPLLVLEYVDGPSLHAHLREKASKGELLPLDRAVQMLRDILLGLACAHANGICHRDLSPMNVLLTSTGIPKIADFGIARVLADRPGHAASTDSAQGGTGNPNFMSPEQARGESADFASDLFMAGIVGYLLLTGRHPFAHPSGLFTVPEMLQNPDYTPDTPKPPPTLQPRDQQLFREYAAIVMRLLHRERAGRYGSAQEAAQTIEDVTPYLECPYCFERLPEHHKFCGLCGKSLEPPALAVANAAAPKAVDIAEQLVEEGFALTRARNLSGAIAKYQAALQVDPTHERAHWNLAFALNRTGQHEEAEKVATRGLDLPTHEHRAGLFYERGFARTNLKRFDDALSDIERALAIHPGSGKFLYYRARIKQYGGDRDGAMIDAREVLRREPGHAGAHRIVFGT